MRVSAITTPPATGSAPPESPVPAPRATKGTPWSVAERHDRLHLGGGRRQHDALGDGAVAGERVALVGAQPLGLADQPRQPGAARARARRGMRRERHGPGR